jgi:hypothetical protein
LSVSLKMDKIKYREFIKFFVKEGLTPNESHSKFIKVYGDSSPLFSTIKKWARTVIYLVNNIKYMVINIKNSGEFLTLITNICCVID